MKRKNNPENFILDPYFFDLAKKVSRNQHINEWHQLLEEHPDQQDQMTEAYRMINAIHISEETVSDQMISENWKQLQRKIRFRKQRHWFYYFSSAAACAALVVSGLFFFESHLSQLLVDHKPEVFASLNSMTLVDSKDIRIFAGEKELATVEKDASILQQEDGSIVINNEKKLNDPVISKNVTLIVPKGKRSSLTLADGTKIWVNSGSKLVYPSRFDKKQREIFVDGEIYLEVARNEACPFIVRTSSLDVKVLGTAFNITAYQDDRFTDVVLVSGSVDVLTGNKPAARLIPSNCFHLKEGFRSVKSVDVYNYICWKEGVMKLDGTPLNEIFTRLSRYYNVEIKYKPTHASIRYAGKLNLDGGIESALYNISLTEPISYSMKDNVITVN